MKNFMKGLFLVNIALAFANLYFGSYGYAIGSILANQFVVFSGVFND